MNAINTRARSFVEQIDEALDRPRAIVAMCGCVLTNQLCFAPEARRQQADEALDRPDLTTTMCHLRSRCREPELRQDLADEALDRAPLYTPFCCKFPDPVPGTAGREEGRLAAETLHCPEASVAITGGMPVSFGPATSEVLADEALDRPVAKTALSAFCHLCWAPQIGAGTQDEALDRPTGLNAWATATRLQ